MLFCYFFPISLFLLIRKSRKREHVVLKIRLLIMNMVYLHDQTVILQILTRYPLFLWPFPNLMDGISSGNKFWIPWDGEVWNKEMTPSCVVSGWLCLSVFVRFSSLMLALVTFTWSVGIKKLDCVSFATWAKLNQQTKEAETFNQQLIAYSTVQQVPSDH